MMESNMSRLAITLTTALVFLAACTEDEDNSGIIEVQIVVQETNIPDAPPPCSTFNHRYEVTFEFECQMGDMTVDVCSDVELCQEQLDEAVADMASCEGELRGGAKLVGDDC